MIPSLWFRLQWDVFDSTFMIGRSRNSNPLQKIWTYDFDCPSFELINRPLRVFNFKMLYKNLHKPAFLSYSQFFFILLHFFYQIYYISTFKLAFLPSKTTQRISSQYRRIKNNKKRICFTFQSFLYSEKNRTLLFTNPSNEFLKCPSSDFLMLLLLFAFHKGP